MFRFQLGVLIFCCITVIETKPAWNPIDLFNQDNDLFEGDIVNVRKNATKTRNGVLFNKWPYGRIPYVLQVSASRQALVKAAMQRIEQNTCIRFIPRTSETDYVRIASTQQGCFSHVGKTGGAQDLNLQDTSSGTCMVHGKIVHELLHAVGLWHAQSRYDRDTYITINYQNIAPENKVQFDIVSASRSSVYNTGYDYMSVMHYHSKAFSKNGGYTIVPKVSSYLNTIGRVSDASATDWIMVNRIYNCAKQLPITQCADSAPTTICLTYVKYCSDSNIYTNCQKTCNRCT